MPIEETGERGLALIV